MIQEILTWLGLFAGVLALVSIVGMLSLTRRVKYTQHIGTFAAGKALRVDELDEKLSKLRESYLSFPNVDDQFKDSLGERLEKIEQELMDFKELLFGNSEVTITIPLIKKDIEMLAQQYKNIKSELDRQGSSTKWFIGILIANSAGLFGLAISILLK